MSVEMFPEGQKGFYHNIRFAVLQKKTWLWFSSYDVAFAIHVEEWNIGPEHAEFSEERLKGMIKTNLVIL